MHNKNECSGTGIAVLSFLAGTVVGAAITLLTAPKSGQETRDMLFEYSSELKDKALTIPEGVREKTHTALDRGREMIEHGKELIEKGTELANQGKEYLDEKKEALSAAIEAGKKAMEQEKEALSQALESDEA